ncbi:Vps52 / Sac2 family protein [Babesia bovis T2Bo]|uniref:Vps52 / Sac2 family protein n=1 Tax=Babesia bovis T2Bo TaxID=484906 RepID=UPI001C35179F|nr:Vps52 / Sac2 family protein [Babesia bovis T2Bo]EDO07722.2 Vps52 / Sac2 family protein [Babesia bovis T2Bo]
MDKSTSISQLLAISPESLADDLAWFLEGFDAPCSLSDIEPWRNEALGRYFVDNVEQHGDDQPSSVEAEPANEDDVDSLDMRVVIELNEIIKRVDSARERWQDDMMETFMRHEEEICEFSTDMNYCDSTLKLIEEALMKHYKSLEAASTDIKNLHSESAELSTCLDNRQAFIKALQTYIDDISIPPSLIMSLRKEPVGEGYIKHLHEFAQKSQKIKTVYGGVSYPSLQLTRIAIHQLDIEIVHRIYSFICIEIERFKTPKANIQMIQDHYFMRLQPLMSFIRETNPNYATEIKTLYGKTMRKKYYHLFSSYYNSLEHYCAKNRYRDISVLTDSSIKHPGGYFTLDGRDALVLSFKDDPLVCTGITPGSLTIEMILKSFLKLLGDSASSEYIFISRFFESDPTSVFHYIFEDTVVFLRSRVGDLLKYSCDVVMLSALSLLIGANRKVMIDRDITALDDALGTIQSELHMKSMYHVKSMAKHVMSYTIHSPSSVVESWLPGIHAINLSNIVHSLLVLKSCQDKLNISGMSFDPVDHLIQVSHAALSLRGRELNNPIKMNILVISNCSAFLSKTHEFKDAVFDFEHTRNKHLKAYVNNYVRSQFENIIQLANVISSDEGSNSQINPGQTNESVDNGASMGSDVQSDVYAKWRIAAEDFVSTGRSKFEAIRAKVKLHFVQEYIYRLVIDATLDTVEYIYSTFHQNVERIAKRCDEPWVRNLPPRDSIRHWLVTAQPN